MTYNNNMNNNNTQTNKKQKKNCIWFWLYELATPAIGKPNPLLYVDRLMAVLNTFECVNLVFYAFNLTLFLNWLFYEYTLVLVGKIIFCVYIAKKKGTYSQEFWTPFFLLDFYIRSFNTIYLIFFLNWPLAI